jgi:hypothetical protein
MPPYFNRVGFLVLSRLVSLCCHVVFMCVFLCWLVLYSALVRRSRTIWAPFFGEGRAGLARTIVQRFAFFEAAGVMSNIRS